MNETISHCDDIQPGDLRQSFTGFVSYLSSSFAYDFNTFDKSERQFPNIMLFAELFYFLFGELYRYLFCHDPISMLQREDNGCTLQTQPLPLAQYTKNTGKRQNLKFGVGECGGARST